MRFLRAKVLLWPLLLVLGVVAATVIVAFGLGATNALALGSLFGSDTRERNSQVIHSVTRQEEVSLLSLGIQGIADDRENGTIFGVTVPGAERVVYLKYEFQAKVGIDGADVDITQTGEDSFLVSIPEFVFIGYDEPRFEMAAEDNGVLSWITPEIDTLEMANRILSADEQKVYIADHEQLLRDQAEVFYTGIMTSIDPGLSIEFEYSE